MQIKKLTLACLMATYPFLSATADETLPQISVTDEDIPSVEQLPTEAMLHSGNTETGALLKQIPGVNAIRKGGHGLDVMIHGQTASRLNILLEGAKIQGGCPNRMDPPTSYAEVESYNDIKVLQGVQSLQYGAGGSGGTVIFQRKAPSYDPHQAIHGNVSALTSSNIMKYDANAEVSAVGKKGYVVIQGAKKEANDYHDGNGDKVRSSYNTTQGHLDLGFTPNEQDSFKLSLERSRTEDALYPGAAMDAPQTEGNMVRLQYARKQVTDNMQHLKVELYRSTVDHLMDNNSFRNTPAAKQSKVPASTTTQGAKIQAQSQWQKSLLTYGIQLQSIEKDARVEKPNDTPKTALWPDIITTTNSAFIESKTPLQNQMQLTAGLRYDLVNAKARDGHSTIGATVPANLYAATYSGYSGKTSQDEGNLNLLLRLQGKATAATQWFAGISRTARTADATERFVAKNVMGGPKSWIGNPDLNPEVHNQLDLGMTGASDTISWKTNVWYDQVNDYIFRDQAKNQSAATANDARTVYVNVDAQLYGANAQMNYALNDNWDLGGQLSLTKGYNTTDHRNLSMMPAPSGMLKAEYTQDKWSAGGRFNFALAQNEIDSQNPNDQKTPAWSTVDLYGNYQINRAFSLSAGVDNLLNHAYYSHLSYDPVDGSGLIHTNEPGQNVWIKAQARF